MAEHRGTTFHLSVPVKSVCRWLWVCLVVQQECRWQAILDSKSLRQSADLVIAPWTRLQTSHTHSLILLVPRSSSVIIQWLCLDLTGHTSRMGQGEDAVIDSCHLHGERDGVLVVCVVAGVILKETCTWISNCVSETSDIRLQK